MIGLQVKLIGKGKTNTQAGETKTGSETTMITHKEF